MRQVALALPDGRPDEWFRVDKFDGRSVDLVDGWLPGATRPLSPHYSRRSPGTSQFLPCGETLVLLSGDGLAVWGVAHNFEPRSDA